MADDENNEPTAGGNPLASLGTGAKALGDLTAGAGSAISAIPIPTGKDSGKVLGLCCGCGCLALFLLIGLLVAFAVGGNFIGARSAEPPPDARAGQSGRGDGGNVTGGTRQGQIDPSQTSGDCAELRGAFAGTDTAIIPIINEAAARWEVSAALVAAVAKQESGFNPFDTNPVSGAQGLMQIMPDTWGDLYDPADGLPNNPYDSRASAFYGAKYLRQLRDQSYIGDNVTLMAAGYNAGPGKVQQYGGVPPYVETQNYARAVMSSYNAYLDCLTAETRPRPAPLVTTDIPGLASDILGNTRIILYPGPADPAADMRAAAYNGKSLSAPMLSAMSELGQTHDYRVTALTGGEHAETSHHYAGRAFDVDLIDGAAVGRTEASKQFMDRCRALGAIEVIGPWADDGNHGDHIHCAWSQ